MGLVSIPSPFLPFSDMSDPWSLALGFLWRQFRACSLCRPAGPEQHLRRVLPWQQWRGWLQRGQRRGKDAGPCAAAATPSQVPETLELVPADLLESAALWPPCFLAPAPPHSPLPMPQVELQPGPAWTLTASSAFILTFVYSTNIHGALNKHEAQC